MRKKPRPRMHGSLPRHALCVCGKVAFDKKGAQTKRNLLLHKGTEKYLRIYECDDKPGAWHITKARHNDDREFDRRY